MSAVSLSLQAASIIPDRVFVVASAPPRLPRGRDGNAKEFKHRGIRHALQKPRFHGAHGVKRIFVQVEDPPVAQFSGCRNEPRILYGFGDCLP
jgi:hypothetical protein